MAPKKLVASTKWIEHIAEQPVKNFCSSVESRRGPVQERGWCRDEKDVENDDPEGKEVINKK